MNAYDLIAFCKDFFPLAFVEPYELFCAKTVNNLEAFVIIFCFDDFCGKRVDFVGGIRGLKELEKRCEEDCVAAIAMYPTTLDELMEVADNGEIMPPKSTWFEPKLRSGIFIHKI